MQKAAQSTGKFGTVVIGGGSGWIGRSLVHAFKKQLNANVVIVSRARETSTAGDKVITWNDLQQSLNTKDNLSKLLHLQDHEPLKAVINVSGKNVLDPFERWNNQKYRQEIMDSRIKTTACLKSLVTATDPEVFVTISGVGFYPYSTTQSYDEEWRNDKMNKSEENFFTQLTREWEDASVIGSECKKTRRVIIRSGVVVGPDGGIIGSSVLPFKLCLGGRMGWTGCQFFPWISLHDLTQMFVFAVTHPTVEGILNGVAPQVIRNKDFASALGKALGRPAIFPLADPIVRLMFGSERGDIMLKGMRVIPKRVLEYGFTYDHPDIDAACRAAVAS